MNSVTARGSFAITIAVWKALLLREALARLFGRRAAWFWLIFEPIFHVAYLMFIFTVIRMRVVGGVDTALWVMVGLLSYFLFQRTARQSMHAVGANHPLFIYRQVKPVDTVLVRALLEGLLTLVVSVSLCLAAGLCGLDVVPDDPLAVLEALLGLWLIGVGYGAMAAVAVEIVPEFGRLLSLLMAPLYLLSGVIFPIALVPQPYRDWLLFNPLVHGLEAVRLGFAPHYHAVSELSIAYVYMFALVTIFFGLLLQLGFGKRMVAE